MISVGQLQLFSQSISKEIIGAHWAIKGSQMRFWLMKIYWLRVLIKTLATPFCPNVIFRQQAPKKLITGLIN
jgi:hypothetical protein